MRPSSSLSTRNKNQGTRPPSGQHVALFTASPASFPYPQSPFLPFPFFSVLLPARVKSEAVGNTHSLTRSAPHRPTAASSSHPAVSPQQRIGVVHFVTFDNATCFLTLFLNLIPRLISRCSLSGTAAAAHAHAADHGVACNCAAQIADVRAQYFASCVPER